jgi:hypothetical protein
MKRIITLFTVVISSIVLFSSCCNSCEESNTTDTHNNSPIVTSTVERVRCVTDRSGYFAMFFRLENGLMGEVQYYVDNNLELNLIEVGDEISYRMNGNYDHFMDSERNDYEVVKVTFKKQDKDNSDSYWN